MNTPEDDEIVSVANLLFIDPTDYTNEQLAEHLEDVVAVLEEINEENLAEFVLEAIKRLS